jgi:hypothetical protein
VKRLRVWPLTVVITPLHKRLFAHVAAAFRRLNRLPVAQSSCEPRPEGKAPVQRALMLLGYTRVRRLQAKPA